MWVLFLVAKETVNAISNNTGEFFFFDPLAQRREREQNAINTRNLSADLFIYTLHHHHHRQVYLTADIKGAGRDHLFGARPRSSTSNNSSRRRHRKHLFHHQRPCCSTVPCQSEASYILLHSLHSLHTSSSSATRKSGVPELDSHIPRRVKAFAIPTSIRGNGIQPPRHVPLISSSPKTFPSFLYPSPFTSSLHCASVPRTLNSNCAYTYERASSSLYIYTSNTFSSHPGS